MEQLKKKIKELKFKQPKYILPLIALPFILFITYQIYDMSTKEEEKKTTQEISTSLGKVDAPILSKNEAYNSLFDKESMDNRTMLQNFEKENDSLFTYSDNLDDARKRYLDSLEYEKSHTKRNLDNYKGEDSYYRPKENGFSTQSQGQSQDQMQQNQDDIEYQRTKELLQMINQPNQTEPVAKEPERDPMQDLRRQMLFLDSLEKSKDPDYQRTMRAQQALKDKKEKMDDYLNKTLSVVKAKNIGGFNHISKESENNTIKAIIDENIKKGYLGSRIRIRLLEDIFIGKKKKLVKKGSFLYAAISGFSLQRVDLSIVSVMIDNEIFPINLSIYDMDGLKGLYVPTSAFREMTRELGANSIQGMNTNSNEGFFTSLASNLFRSASEAIAAIIRKNKVTLKYSTYIYLINEKELNQSKNEE